MSTLERVQEVLSQVLGCDPGHAVPGITLLDLGADSLDHQDIIIELEEAFNLEISDKDSEGLRTVGDIVTYIDKRAAA